MIKRLFVVALSSIVLASCQSAGPASLNVPAPPVPAHIQRALDAPDRTAAMRQRDAGRKPGQVFALAGLKEGDKVIEIASFGQYDTTIITGAIGPRGHVYMYDLPYMQARAEGPSRAFVAAHPNTEYQIGKFDDLTYPGGVDMVVIDMYYHDLKPAGVDTAVLNRKLYQALKPGGRMLIVDHKAQAGSGWRDAATIHRMGVETIVQEVAAAGFRLIIDSDLFANPKDDHSKMVFEPGERGATDRALFVFEKPRR